jgi:GTP pyrophosphokinase
MSNSSLLDPLKTALTQNHPDFDQSKLQKAFDVASSAHAGQKRKSGEDYITHPVAVAQILVDSGMDLATINAALLHDTVEDTGLKISDIAKDFGDEVASLVDGVTKLDKLTYGPTAEAETLSQNGSCHVTRHSSSGYKTCRSLTQCQNLGFCRSKQRSP